MKDKMEGQKDTEEYCKVGRQRETRHISKSLIGDAEISALLDELEKVEKKL